MKQLLVGPTDYVELLQKLSIYTFFTTLILLSVLTNMGLLAKINMFSEIDFNLILNQKTWVWLLTNGSLPIFLSSVAYVLSRGLEMHNLIAKATQLRFFWDKHFIVRRIVERVGKDIPLNRANVYFIMNNLYYPELKNIDQNYVRVFWNYEMFFWALFEHLVVVILIQAYFIFSDCKIEFGLLIYSLGLSVLLVFQLFFVTGKKSTDQANQIKFEKIKQFFEKNFPY